MQYEVVDITPSVASEWLQCNQGNRPLRRTWVENFKDVFSRGEYITTHQGVAFSEDGTLLDGQHRLTAIAEMPAGFSVSMLVATGLPAKAFMALDQGGKRTASDILKEGTRLVEVARMLAKIQIGRPNGITPQYLVPFIDFARPFHDELLDFCPTVARVFGAVSFRTAAVVLLAEGVDPDYVKLTYRSLVHADFAAMPQSGQVLYRSFLAGGLKATDAIDTLSRALKVMDPAQANLKMVKVSGLAPTHERVKALLLRNGIGVKKKAGLTSPAKKSTKSHYRAVAA